MIRRPAAERGYDYTHRKLRAALLAAMRDGQPCASCGRPMYRAQARYLDLGHDDRDRTRYIGLEHRRCNRARGAAAGNRARGRRKHSGQVPASRIERKGARMPKETAVYTSVGLEITRDARTVYVAVAGVAAVGRRAVVELLPPVPADEATGRVAALSRDLPIDHVVVDPDGNGVARSELRAAFVPLLEVTATQRGEAAARFKMWTRGGRLTHRGHRDLTVAARAAEVKRSVSGVEQMVRRDAAVDPAALLAAQLAVFGLAADLTEGGLGPDDVYIGGWEPGPAPLREGALPDWPGARIPPELPPLPA
jgi:hypothetical protein